MSSILVKKTWAYSGGGVKGGLKMFEKGEINFKNVGFAPLPLSEYLDTPLVGN